MRPKEEICSFLSYGGSSLLSYMIAMGIFLDIEKQTRIIEGKKRY